MTDAALIPKGHHGMVWLFTVSAGVHNPIGALGIDGIDSGGIEEIDLDALASYGLARYLTEAAGFDPAEVEADRTRLDALRGRALVVHSRALPDGPARFVPGPGLTLIARYGTAPSEADLTPLRSESADGILAPRGKAPMSNARMSGKVAMAALLVAFAVVVWIIWSSG